MIYKLKYHPDVKRSDLPKIDAKNKNMIKRAIEQRLVTHPETYGKPLQRTLKGYWKLRVGDYRVVFKVFSDDILILGIIHRKEVYRLIEKRIKDRKL
ncbi:MAG: type II toxin-antitoxin system RelE/ParE family toxin [Proteobacteria bacterium]|nr:type II toxin-antitoxin system RelE/ParE family toxin [Desulfobacteraceae bacterium]MBU4013864.1 type II toxin-antitoxin system RelE/ParE family toxin [Pseudomonadota bacterium]MBU4068203.1 type II toxin-antitoxin system RelE/ParE family toxin [Pseudomonadota bacterium]MBU4100008.1 type II toxin-antitoxin system RelE/ParE family toxin [Pseudomonadota bacterium]MBU4125932.1 type II toxin-antitoxin system RelE/ParE family toxin [Pseudomonadota bacterium]